MGNVCKQTTKLKKHQVPHSSAPSYRYSLLFESVNSVGISFGLIRLSISENNLPAFSIVMASKINDKCIFIAESYPFFWFQVNHFDNKILLTNDQQKQFPEITQQS